jgi:hypothetical protein
VRARINSRSNSAKPPSTVNIKSPCAGVVSAHDIEGTKTHALAGDRCQRVQEVAGRAHQAVETRDGEHVALGELREHTGELGAVGLRPAGLLAVDFGATFGAERLELSVERQPIGADAGVFELAILRASLDHIFCKP